MDDILVIGAGPAGLLAAWLARQRGARVRLLAAGIGTTHVSPGWVQVLGIGGRREPGTRGDLGAALASFVAAHPEHPYALAGLEALWGGLAALREVGEAAGIRYVGGLTPPGPPLPTAKGVLSGEGGADAGRASPSPDHRGFGGGQESGSGGEAAAGFLDLTPPGPPLPTAKDVLSGEGGADAGRASPSPDHRGFGGGQERGPGGEAAAGFGGGQERGPGGEAAANFLLPTALGATVEAALAPESFAAGDLRQPGPMLIAGPAGWRDFFPRLCAENLARHGFPARGITFELPEMAGLSKFDATPVGLARLFESAAVRQRVAAQLKPRLEGAARVGFPAVLGLEHASEAWSDLQERLGVPVFEIPTLPPSVPGMRLYNAFKSSLARLGVPILLDMTATRAVVEGNRVTGVVVPDVVRDRTYGAGAIILATGGLYGGGIASDHAGMLREAVFGLPLYTPGGLGEWFEPQFLGGRGHPIHQAGVRVNAAMQPVDADGGVVLENVRIAGRLLAHYDPLAEGSTEGVWLATAFRAALTA